MKVVLGSSPANRIAVKNQILTVGLIAAITLVVTQTILDSEVNAAKEFVVDCEFIEIEGSTRENRRCCEWEVDTETGEATLIGCYIESCHQDTGACTIIDDPTGPAVDPRDLAQGLGEREVLPTPPTSGGSTPGGIRDRPLGEQEVFPTPPETTMQEDTSITDRPTDEGEILPTPPSIVKETTPLQQPPLTIEEEPETTPEPEECKEGETFNEQTGECEPIGEPEAQELEEPEQTEPVEQQSSEE